MDSLVANTMALQEEVRALQATLNGLQAQIEMLATCSSGTAESRGSWKPHYGLYYLLRACLRFW